MNLIATMKQEMLDVLTDNILSFWLDQMQDHEHGGFYGRMDGHCLLHPDAEKGAILNARILWAFSAAYRVLSRHTPDSPHLDEYPSIRRSNSTPSASSSTGSASMPVPPPTARPSTLPCSSSTV